MKKLPLLLLIVLLTAFVLPVSAQSEASLYFLLEQGGTSVVYRGTLSGAPTPITTPEQGSVAVYDVEAGAVAYAAQALDGSLILYVTDSATGATLNTPLPGRDASQLVLTADAVYVTFRNLEGKPTIMGFDRAALTQTTQRSTNLSDSALTIHASGRWVLAYNPNGATDVFSLPGANTVDFQLPDFGNTEPRWSPTGEQLQFVGGVDSEPDNRYLYILDFAAGTNVRYPVPNVGRLAKATWSDHGRYIVTPGAADGSSLLIFDVLTGVATALDEPGFLLTPVSWSSGDSWLLYTAQISAVSSNLFVLNIATGERFPVTSDAATAVSAQWSPTGDSLAVIGITPGNTIGIFRITVPAFNAWTLQAANADGGITRAGMIWVGDSLLLEYNSALLTVDAASGSLLLLSPLEYPVVAGSVRVQEST